MVHATLNYSPTCGFPGISCLDSAQACLSHVPHDIEDPCFPSPSALNNY